MIRRGRSAVAGLLAAGLVVLGGCGALPRSTFEDESVVTEPVTSVRLDLGNGGVTLRGAADATEVSVHRSVRHRGSRPEDPTFEVTGDVLVLRGCGRNCGVDYTVDLPAGLPVSGETSNGAIRLSGVGEVDVRTSNGAIRLDGASGPVVVGTDNGRVDITLDEPQDVRAETSNGAITLTVPDGTYQVSTHTGNGRVDNAIPDDPAGEHRLDLSAGNGAITVRTA